jgi:hypothetical protein
LWQLLCCFWDAHLPGKRSENSAATRWRFKQAVFLLLPLLMPLLLLQYGGPAAQEAAAAAIENLSLDSECEAALGAEGAIEGLLQVLRDGSTAAQVS